MVLLRFYVMYLCRAMPCSYSARAVLEPITKPSHEEVIVQGEVLETVKGAIKLSRYKS